MMLQALTATFLTIWMSAHISQAASLVKRGFAPESMDAFASGGYNLKAKRPFCNAFDGCGGKKRSADSGLSPDATEALVKALSAAAAGSNQAADDIEELLMSGLFGGEAGGNAAIDGLYFGGRVRREVEEAAEVSNDVTAESSSQE